MCPTGTGTGSALPQTTGKGADFRSAFDVLDVDHDGKISREDLRTFYGDEYEDEDEDEDEDVIGSMMSVADSNEDGYVEYEEFENVLLNMRKRTSSCGGTAGSVMEDVFRVMDKDGDGKVGHDDLKSYLNLAGFDASDDDIKAMIRLGGGDELHDHGVTFDGLLKILEGLISNY